MSWPELLRTVPTGVIWPLFIAAALPLLAYLGVRVTSRRLSGTLALRFALRVAMLLACGFAIVVAVATLEVLHTGLGDRAARYQSATTALARGLSSIPNVLEDSARARPRLEIALATEDRAIWSVLLPLRGEQVVLAHAGALPDTDLPMMTAAARRAAAHESAALLRRRGRLELLLLAAVRSVDGQPVGTVVLAVDTRELTATATRTAWLLLAWTSILLLGSIVLTRRLIVLSVSVRVTGLIARLQGAGATSGTAPPPHRDELQQLRAEVDRTVESIVRLQRENDAQYEVIVERMPDAVLICHGSTIRLANAAAARLFGAGSSNALVGTDFHARVSQDAGVRDSGTRQRWRLRRDDGAERHVEISEEILPVSGETLTEFVVRDVTESVRAELSLARSEAGYRTLFDSAPIGISVVDERLKVEAANPALLRLFSLTRHDEIVGRMLPEEVKLPTAALDGLRRGIAGGGIARIDVEFTPADGAPRYAMVTMQRLASGGGTAQFELLWLDLTAQRTLEAQVQHTQKLEAVGQLSSGIAHDFNNLLTVIRANASLLAASRGRVHELDAIEEASVRGAALIRKLLIFSRKQDLAPQPWSVALLFHELLAVLRRLVPASIELRAPGDVPDVSVMVDRVAFEQVMINLVTNACDAMPDGGVLAIDVRIVPGSGQPVVVSSDAASLVQFTVTDCGPGMAAGVKERAFEPFFTTKPPEKGTGLGLAIVYGLVTQMHGTVSLRDAAGGGTSVAVLLPACAAVPNGPQTPAGNAAVRGTERLLLVEDDDSVRRSTAKLIASFGYQVSTAEDGVAAMSLLDAGPLPDLIVSDVMMPAMGGVELVQLIRARGWTMPILLVSGYSTESLTAIVTRDPSIGILGKPWSVVELSRELRRRLDLATQARKTPERLSPQL